ncbi:uncharacterized protein [Typha latifolia]|uniref:uncharacterized protein n=1 Tax=Typha latifolia TaxID=4733 RepID=UPI003C2F74AE
MGGELDRWEEAIDIDDSDLPSLLPSFPALLPCSQLPRPSQALAPNPSPSSRPSPVRPNSPTSVSGSQPRDSPPGSIIAASSFPHLIPGPAGAVQAAMHRMSAAVESGPRLEGIDKPGDRLDLDEDDADFKMNPWLFALGFLGEDCGSVSTIGSIKTRTVDRAPLVVGVVKCCTPNGLGDLFLTLKDPTGTIDASLHRRVILEGNFGSDISIGCILILKKVVVFSSARSVCYLNITLDNVVKLISNDCSPPHKLVIPSGTARLHLPDKHRDIRQKSRCEMENPAHGEMSNMTYSRVIAGKEEIEGSFLCSSGARDATTAVATNTNHCLGKRQNFWIGEVAGHPSGRHKPINPDEDFRRNLNFLGRQQEIGLNEVRGDPSNKHISTNCPGEAMIRNSNCETLIGSGKTSFGGKLARSANATTATISMSSEPEHEKNDTRNLTSRVSVAQWTDEQLSELFADYQE